jgi:uncharacterized membrane protein
MNRRGIGGAVGLGAACGLRSLAGLGMWSRELSARPRARGEINRLLSSRPASLGLAAAMAGELAFDKLPFVPARVTPAPLAGRALLGGLTGWAVALQRRGDPILCAAAGAAGAVAAAWAGYAVRRRLTAAYGLPDAAVAVCEDALALGGARAIARRA